MSLLVPGALFFLATLPVIAALYFLKLKRTRRVISSTLLWRRAVTELRANTPFQRLRANLLLLLQLLLAAALALALARPYLPGAGRLASRRVLVIDASASMGAVHDGRSRFDEARARAMEIVGGASEATETMIVVAGPRASVAQAFTSDRRTIEDALARLRPTEGPADLVRAISLALAITAKDEGRDVVLLSDGAAPALPDILARAKGVRLERVGRAAPNLGITSFDAVRSATSLLDWEVFTGVTSFSEGAEEATVRLLLKKDGVIVDARSLRIPARQTRGAIMSLQGGGEAVSVELAIEDALACDNAAVGILPPPEDRRVLVVSPSGSIDPWLAKALKPQPGIQVTSTTPGRGLDPALYDMVIFDGTTPADVPPGSYLFLDPAGDVTSEGRLLFRAAEAVPFPVILDWDRDQSLLRFVTFADVHLRQGRVLVPGDGVEVLAEIEAGPVVVGDLSGPARFAALGFDFRASDMPYRAAFPILLGNAVSVLPLRGKASRPITEPAGRGLHLDLPPGFSGEVVVEDPLGSRRAVRGLSGRYLFDETWRTGLYRAVVNERVVDRFGVSLLSSEESDLRPRLEVPGEKAADGASTMLSVRKELYPWLLGLGLLVLCLEWAAYHRRSFA